MPKRKKTRKEKLEGKQAWKEYKETRTPEKHEKDKERIRNAVRRFRASGKNKEYEKKRRAKKQKELDKHRITIDDKELWEEGYASRKMLRIKYSTYMSYKTRRVIPQPIYQKFRERSTVKYLSRRQINLINRIFGPKFKHKSLGEKSERLFSEWTKDEMGFGSESDDGDKDSK